MTHLLACGCDVGCVVVLTLTAARPALWSTFSVYPTLTLITAAIDEVRGGRLVPGLLQLDERFISSTPAANNSSSAASHATTQAGQAEEEEEDV